MTYAVRLLTATRARTDPWVTSNPVLSHTICRRSDLVQSGGRAQFSGLCKIGAYYTAKLQFFQELSLKVGSAYYTSVRIIIEFLWYLPLQCFVKKYYCWSSVCLCVECYMSCLEY